MVIITTVISDCIMNDSNQATTFVNGGHIEAAHSDVQNATNLDSDQPSIASAASDSPSKGMFDIAMVLLLTNKSHFKFCEKCAALFCHSNNDTPISLAGF